ncbi:LysR family transcriptional regulator [Vibrio splendidus]|uniref:LysR family transcriptional regulator n=1 Tax=Vibrio splendidus TaxID=29497 RepID=UPI003D114982
MKLSNVDLNLLKVFVVVYQEQSLRKASEKLFVSTSAVSQSIKKLKESLGEELFVLSNKQFLPTPYSDQLYQRISPLLDGLFTAIAEGKRFNPAGLEDTFHIEANPHILSWLTPALYQQVSNESPKATLVTHTISQHSLEKLQHGTVDFVVHFGTNELPSEIIAVPLGNLKFVLAARVDHPFKGTKAKVEELVCYPFAHIDLAYFDKSKKSRIEEEALLRGTSLKMSLRTTSVVGLIGTVKQSNVLAPCMVPVIEQHRHDIRAITVEGLGGIDDIEVFAYIHKRNQHSAKYKWLLDLIEVAMFEKDHE